MEICNRSMATLSDIMVGAAINILTAFAYFLAFAVLRIQPINDRVYYPKMVSKKLKKQPNEDRAISRQVCQLEFQIIFQIPDLDARRVTNARIQSYRTCRLGLCNLLTWDYVATRSYRALELFGSFFSKLALKAGVFYDQVSNMTIWGNHSTTQVSDFLNARINGLPVKEVITDHKWLEEEFTEKVQKRGGVLIQKWGRSAASTFVSIVDAIKSLVTPTPERDWFYSGVYTNGNPYGIAEELVFSMHCRSKGDGDYELVKDVIIDDYLLERIKKTEAELLAEKRCTAHLTGEGIPVCDLPGDTMLLGEV